MVNFRLSLTVNTLVLLLSEQGGAFSPTSSFVRRSNTYVALTPPSQQTFGVASGHCVGSTTALSMNLFDRFSRVAKSNLNNILKNLEDPEKIMNQAVEDMQGDLVKVRQSYAEITATQRRLLKQKEQAETLANDWYTRAQLALQKGNEELAREALARRQQQVEVMTNLQSQINLQTAAIDKLYDGMKELESRIMEARMKKEQMIARARTAQSTQKVNDMLTGITGKTSMDAFKRMEDKVEALEAAAEVSAEMGMASGNLLPGSSLEKEFRLLEGSAAVDDELKRMKGLLNPAPGPSSAGVDDELERLKREAGL